MRDVNELERRRVFPDREIGLIFIVALIVYFALIFFVPNGDSEIPGMSHSRLFFLLALGLSLALSPAVILVLVSRYIDNAAGVKRSNLPIFLLTFAMFASFPIVQQRMNELIESRRGKENIANLKL
jgi:hypothetical protein